MQGTVVVHLLPPLGKVLFVAFFRLWPARCPRQRHDSAAPDAVVGTVTDECGIASNLGKKWAPGAASEADSPPGLGHLGADVAGKPAYT